MRNILVYAYQLNSWSGSEYALAWDYILNMSRDNRLTVLYGTCEGFHKIGNTEAFEKYLADNPLPNVTFIAVKPSFKMDFQDYSVLGIRRFYKQYRKYQMDVLQVARELFEKEPFTLVHYLGPIGFREPGLLWQLPCPFMWGPVGGVTSPSLSMLAGASGISGVLTPLMKKCVNWWQLRMSSTIRNAMRRADLVMGCTSETASILKSCFHLDNDHLFYYPQNCIKGVHPLNYSKFDGGKVRLIWIGRIDSNKSLITALKSIYLMENKSEIELTVVGGGQGKVASRCRKYVEDHGMDSIVKFIGNVPREKVFTLLDESHVHIITSLLDVNPTILWEAMSFCVPTVSVARNGMEDIITDDTGVLIPVNNYGQVIREYASALDELVDNRSRLKEMAEKLQDCRENYSWGTRRSTINEQYDLAVRNFGLRNNH